MYALNLNIAFDARRAGGKAARLAQAIALGMRVSPGFVILQESLKLFLVGADLYWRVHHYLQDCNPQKPDRIRQQFIELCTSAEAAPIPVLIKKEIEPLTVDWLANAPAGLAVRSSGANEDLPTASFAGIYDSFLGVSTLPGLWENVVRC